MSQYKAHIFICESCSYKENGKEVLSPLSVTRFRKEIKEMAHKKWPKFEVRINGSKCLGKCASGINCVVYPHNKWLENLSPSEENKQKVIDLVELCLEKGDS